MIRVGLPHDERHQQYAADQERTDNDGIRPAVARSFDDGVEQRQQCQDGEDRSHEIESRRVFVA